MTREGEGNGVEWSGEDDKKEDRRITCQTVVWV